MKNLDSIEALLLNIYGLNQIIRHLANELL
jgi:hypothetical protein